jgi:hypothetical protein
MAEPGVAPVTGDTTPAMSEVVIVVAVAGKRTVNIFVPAVYVDVMPLTVKKLFVNPAKVKPDPAVRVMVAV